MLIKFTLDFRNTWEIWTNIFVYITQALYLMTLVSGV